MQGGLPRYLNYGNPINRAHPLMRGLVSRWKAINPFGRQFLDLATRNHASHNGTWTGDSFNVSGGTRIAIPDFTNIAAGNNTIHVVHRPTAWDAGGFTALWDKFGSAREHMATFDTNGDMDYSEVGGETPYPTGYPFATGMTAGTKWWLTWVRIGNAITVYVNGVLKASYTHTGVTASPGTWNFGDNPSAGGANYNGRYYEIAYWNRGMSESEVRSLYQATRQRQDPTLNYYSHPIIQAAAAPGGTTQNYLTLLGVGA